MRLVVFQRRLLKLAVKVAGPGAWDLATFESVLKPKAGKWFFEHCEKPKSKWRAKFKTLCEVCHLDPVGAAAILPAFRNDIAFPQSFSKTGFPLLFSSCAKPIKDAIQSLMEYCYDYFSKSGFPDPVHGIRKLNLNRKWFLACHVSSNTKLCVCPVCDGPQEMVPVNFGTKRKPLRKAIPINDLDHFFPKSQYPFFSLHPANLIPSCKNCNFYFKGTEDPLTNGGGRAVLSDAFLHTYYSFQGRAIRQLGTIEVSRVKLKANEFGVRIVDANRGATRRVETAERVFKLTERWRLRLEGAGELIGDPDAGKGIVRRVVERLNHQASSRTDATVADLENVIQGEKSLCEIGSGENDTIRVAYFDYALTNAIELSALFKVYSGHS